MPRIILAIARFTLLEGSRTRFFWLAAGIALAGLGLAAFAGELAVAENRAIQASLLGAFLRLAGVIALGLFVLNSQMREFEEKGAELLLALPIPRAVYFLGRLGGFLGVAVPVVVLFTLTVSLFAAPGAALPWGVSLFLELALVAALALFCLLTFHHATPAFAVVLAFYLLARAIGSLRLIGHGPLMSLNDPPLRLMTQALDLLAYLLPDLDRFTRSEWLAYGGVGWGDLAFVGVQSAVYLLLLTAAALFDLYRKSF